tara:strand:+ start:417 stop:665 length:249 start_codon:yes stop_codon:yes gene_type:complete
MPKMKNSYKQARATFVDTAYGNVAIELAVGQSKVIVKDSQGIKLSLPIAELRESKHELIKAARDKDKDKFKGLCDTLEAINA